MDAVGAARPEVDDEAEVTPRDHRYPVSTRVEQVTGETVVVRPSVGDFADQEVVRVGDHVQVFWRDATDVWALPAQVAVVDAFGGPPVPGSVVLLTVHLEDGDVTSRAEVVWHHTRGGRWALSLRFLDLPEREQDRVRRRVFRAMREERARHSS